MRAVLKAGFHDEMGKLAFGSAMLAAGRGMLGFARGAGKNIVHAARTGGAKSGLNMAKSVGAEGAHMAGRFAQRNPGAAATIGAGAFTAAGAAGRLSAPSQKQ